MPMLPQIPTPSAVNKKGVKLFTKENDAVVMILPEQKKKVLSHADASCQTTEAF